MIFGRDDNRAGEISLDDSIERIKAVLLIHAIRSSPGGYKLSDEMVRWLALHFEDCYLPSNAPAMAKMIEDANRSYSKNREDAWYDQRKQSRPRRRGLRDRARKLFEWLKIRF